MAPLPRAGVLGFFAFSPAPLALCVDAFLAPREASLVLATGLDFAAGLVFATGLVFETDLAVATGLLFSAGLVDAIARVLAGEVFFLARVVVAAFFTRA
ncbi:MAG: hypothetical protein ACOY0T_28870 [Myxococcota bacterium]